MVCVLSQTYHATSTYDTPLTIISIFFSVKSYISQVVTVRQVSDLIPHEILIILPHSFHNSESYLTLIH